MQTEYIGTTEVAKYLRQILSESFPGIKFSVKSKKYSGGSSINVSWTDGPTERQVKAHIEPLEGSYFDGMIDYKGSRYHKLDGKPVHLMADFIFCNRSLSDEVMARVISMIERKYGFTPGATPQQYHKGEMWSLFPDRDTRSYQHESMQSRIHTEGAKWSQVAMALESPTLKRFQSAGDDGYGEGTTGRIE